MFSLKKTKSQLKDKIGKLPSIWTSESLQCHGKYTFHIYEIETKL